MHIAQKAENILHKTCELCERPFDTFFIYKVYCSQRCKDWSNKIKVADKYKAIIEKEKHTKIYPPIKEEQEKEVIPPQFIGLNRAQIKWIKSKGYEGFGDIPIGIMQAAKANNFF